MAGHSVLDMSDVTENPPDGTPTWIDFGIPDLERAMDFYRAVFDWEFDVGPAEAMQYTICRLRGKAVAGLAVAEPDPAGHWWTVYFAVGDCAAAVDRAQEAGAVVVAPADEVPDRGTLAMLRDPVGAPFGLWQGDPFVGCELVNEPGTLLRNDLVTPDPEPARAFYTTVLGFTLGGDDNMPDMDFTFLRRPDGHEIGGIIGVPDAPASAWGTLFQVEDADATVARIREAGGTAKDPTDMPYGRLSEATDPFGARFSIGSPLRD